MIRRNLYLFVIEKHSGKEKIKIIIREEVSFQSKMKNIDNVA